MVISKTLDNLKDWISKMSNVKIGERMKIPVHSIFHQESGHVGKIVFISEDGNTVTVKCDRKHGGKTVAFNIALQPRDY